MITQFLMLKTNTILELRIKEKDYNSQLYTLHESIKNGWFSNTIDDLKPVYYSGKDFLTILQKYYHITEDKRIKKLMNDYINEFNVFVNGMNTLKNRSLTQQECDNLFNSLGNTITICSKILKKLPKISCLLLSYTIPFVLGILVEGFFNIFQFFEH